MNHSLRERKLIVGCAGENPNYQRILKLQITNGELIRWSLGLGACLALSAWHLELPASVSLAGYACRHIPAMKR